MRKIFEQSSETQKLVELFKQLKYEQRLSFEYASEAVGFKVTSTMPAYQSAKRIVERDYGVFIAAVRGVGFVRGNGSDMVNSGSSIFHSIKNKAKKCASRMIIAVNENLTEDEHRQANEMYARANIIISTTTPSRAQSNAQRKSKPNNSSKFDFIGAIKGIGEKGR